jgi:peptidoglycan glycosyltransferase
MGRWRRNTELGLVLFAALVTVAAYVLASFGRTADLPPNIIPFLVFVVALLLVAHVATRFLARGADEVLLPVALLLNGLGYVFIARVREDLAANQATWTLIGIGAFVATLILVPRASDLARYKWTFALIGIGLLLLPFVPGVGRIVNGSRLWVKVGPVNFQPGEFAKIALALFFAAYLVEKREVLAMASWKVGPLRLPEPRDLGPILVAWAFSLVILIGQRDLGSSLLFFALFIVMLWVATERPAYLAIGGLLFAAGAYLAWTLFGHVQDRVSIWLDPWADVTDSGYQIAQSVYAFSWGGLLGTGLGRGDPTRIPEVQNDFIFSAIGEELGLFGATAIIISYLLMMGAGYRVASRADRPFEKLLAAGLTTILGVQAFIILAGVTRVLPLTGVTLPFVSYGGSSLVANYVLLALLLRISDTTSQRLGETPASKRPPRFLRRLRPELEPVP